MAPVTLNQHQNTNKAGIQVDVIPIMRSPCSSPKPRKRDSKRAKSEMSFRKERTDVDRGSLPDIFAPKLGLVDKILYMSPERFLNKNTGSTESLAGSYSESAGKSAESDESLSKGVIMNAVVNWLQKSSPFNSTDNLISNSYPLSNQDNSNISLGDEEDFLSERSISRSDNLPDIFITDDDTLLIIKEECDLQEEGVMESMIYSEDVQKEISKDTISKDIISIGSTPEDKAKQEETEQKPTSSKDPKTKHFLYHPEAQTDVGSVELKNIIEQQYLISQEEINQGDSINEELRSPPDRPRSRTDLRRIHCDVRDTPLGK